MNELKACPFCDGEAETAQNFEYYAVKCKKCGARTDFMWKKEQGIKYDDALEEAIKAWNTRPDVSIGISREEAKELFPRLEWKISIGCFNEAYDAVEKTIDEIYDSIELKNVVVEWNFVCTKCKKLLTVTEKEDNSLEECPYCGTYNDVTIQEKQDD